MEKDNFNANVDFVRGQADIIVLSALADKDKYGLEILNTIQERSKGTYTLKQATLYNSLKRLEKSGYIKSYDGDVSNGAKRVYYGLTPQGLEHLNNDKSYWEFCNFLMTNLVSNEVFDPETEEKPFDPTEFRPLTRRNKPEQEKEKEVIIKYIEVVRTPEEMQQRQNEQNQNYSNQYVISDKPVDDSAILREVESPDIVENINNKSDLSEKVNEESQSVAQNSQDISEHEDSLDDNFVEEPEEEYVQSSFINESGELNENADIQSQLPENDNIVESKENLGIDTNKAEFVQTNNQSAEYSPSHYNEKQEQSSVSINNYDSSSYRQHENILYSQPVQHEQPSPVYQSNNYFDENNEVNYVSSFADLFRIEEEQPVQDVPEYDIMSMNEMVFKFQAKGVTIKPYNKKNTMEFYVNRYYYSNKLHMHTALIMFFVIAIEILAAHFICNRNNPISNYWLFSLLAVAIYPIVRIIMYAIEPNRKSLANFNPKSALLISLLPVITLPIVIALIGFVQFGANINDYSSMERTIILPCVLLFNIPCYFFVFAMKYRTNKYHIN